MMGRPTLSLKALRGRMMRPGAQAFVGGLMAAFGHAPFGLWVFTIVGLSVAFQHFDLTTPKVAFRRGFWIGFGYFGLTLAWIINPFFVDPTVTAWMAPFGWAGMAAGMALFWGAGAAAAAWLAATGWRRRLALAVALTLAEALRGSVMRGFPWGAPGYVFIDTPFAQLLSLVGPLGLTFFAFVSAAFLGRMRHKMRTLIVLNVIWGIVLFWGIARERDLPEPSLDPAQKPVVVRLVQPNAPQHLKWDPDHVWRFYDDALGLSRAAPDPNGPTGTKRPDLIVWPETSVPGLLGQADDLKQEMAAAAQGAVTAFGINRLVGARGYNSLVVMAPDAQTWAIYDKHHLVPFGEFIPFPALLSRIGLGTFTAAKGYGYSAGIGPRLLDLGVLGRVLPLICYEAIFPGGMRVTSSDPGADKRPDWILHITNDAWFGRRMGPEQHLNQVRARAIEQGLPVLRAANTGITAVIDARGHIVASLPPGQTAALDAYLPPSAAPTYFSAHGTGPVVAILMLFCLGLRVGRKPAQQQSV